jgi:hypothetical protein
MKEMANSLPIERQAFDEIRVPHEWETERECPLSGVKRTCLIALQMSADPKRKSLVAPHTSAFTAKADMTFRDNPLSRSLSGAPFAAQMSANDPEPLHASKLLGRSV